MHIEPEIVNAAKMGLSYATATAVTVMLTQVMIKHIKKAGVVSLLLKSVVTTVLTLVFFELFPHYFVGVSEVHLILGSTLFLLFGSASAGVGLALGLLVQGLLFSPMDLPQYGMNVTTLLVPLFALSWMAKRVLPKEVSYSDLNYYEVLKLSSAYQVGIVVWVAFWAFYAEGFAVENIVAVSSFGLAYMGVIVVEPLISLASLALAKSFKQRRASAELSI